MKKIQFNIIKNFTGCVLFDGKSSGTLKKYKINDIIILNTDDKEIIKDKFWRNRLRDKDIEIISEKPTKKPAEKSITKKKD